MTRLRVAHRLPSHAAPAAQLTTERVWGQLDKASFAVISHVTPAGRPRASGVVYAAEGRRLYVATDPDSWKTRQISDGEEVTVTVPLRRGG